jgi:hypothetical protein
LDDEKGTPNNKGTIPLGEGVSEVTTAQKQAG